MLGAGSGPVPNPKPVPTAGPGTGKIGGGLLALEASRREEDAPDCSVAFTGGLLRTRISFRMRILIVWSASEHDNGVDSVDETQLACHPHTKGVYQSNQPSMPGNFLAV
jgi:hypothetical protein